MLEFSQFQNNTALISFERGCEKNVEDIGMKKEAASGECVWCRNCKWSKGVYFNKTVKTTDNH